MGPGAHQPYKEFGSDVHHKMHFFGRDKWKPDSNPPPGTYDPRVTQTKASSYMANINNDKTRRSDFTQTPLQDNPSGGNYQKIKKFGSDVNTKVNFGSKYKWKPDSNPPPGLYNTERAMTFTKPRVSTANLLDKSKRKDFTK